MITVQSRVSTNDVRARILRLPKQSVGFALASSPGGNDYVAY